MPDSDPTDLGAKLEQERQWAVGILRTMADKLEGLSLDDVTEPLTLVMGPVEDLDQTAHRAGLRRTGAMLVVGMLVALAFLQPATAYAGSKKRTHAPAAKPSPASPGKPFDLSASDVAAIHRGVEERLKDPESARYGPIAAAQAENTVIYVCGFVNAKNSYGGYTGMEPFIGILTQGRGGFAAVGVGGSESELSATLKLCKRHGIAGF